ncbi:DUF4167 domain-containing protein [Rhodobacteraceae bacterium XHP0102]|nr:DUF4167 domain-containing protein [Rhodobacteraceae bacterium XHP0102]
MRSSKNRSRSKGNRNRSVGNIINRVFDSSGPEGKVRGTPQQIIDKYQQLARDAQLSNDRVAAENFLQHSEHYTRLLGEAQREMDARREEHQNGNGGQNGHNGNDRRSYAAEDEADMGSTATADVAPHETDGLTIAPDADTDAPSNLVETPESKPRAKRNTRGPRRPRKAEDADSDPAPMVAVASDAQDE